MSKLFDYLKRVFGFGVHSTWKVVTAGTSVIQGLENNPNRVQVTIMNASANTLYVHPDASVSSTHCLKILSGGSLSLTAREDGAIVGYPWHFLASAGASAIDVFETVAD